MIIKRKSKAPLILPVEDHRKATQFVALLFAVGSRVGTTRKSKGRPIKKDKWVRENIRGPCFFEGFSINSALSRSIIFLLCNYNLN